MSAISEIMPPRKLVTLRLLSMPSVMDAARLMAKKRIGAVVLVDVDGQPAGIITERDILKKVTAVDKRPGDIAAQDIMSYPVIAVKSYDSIETASALMAKKKVKRLVVLEEDGSLAGILSITDITTKLAKILANDYKRYGRFKAILDIQKTESA